MYLRVLGKRDDGFHDLDTLFQQINVVDDLLWNPGDEPLSLEVKGAQLGPVGDNLIVRAFQRVNRELDTPVGGQMVVTKRIPIGGGLGGGSANAGATLGAINRYLGDRFSRDELVRFAADLGSDVPFFIEGGCQRGRGRGERLEIAVPPHGTPNFGCLVLPPFGISTAEVFRNLVVEAHSKPELGDNDLFETALAVEPRLRALDAELRPLAVGPWFMSGSGSTMVHLGAPLDCDLSTTARRLGCMVVPFQFL
ncbi:MAG: hypothetical protein KDC35_17835 [Acidobacteria bacterium]|nr:hypothetical protein [Acidobacteriota bacterium]